MLVFAVALAVATHSFAACDTRVSSAPEALDSYLCYRAVARGNGRAAEAARRLRTHISRDPGNPGPRLALAFVEFDRARDEAGPLFRGAADAFAARGDADAEVRALSGLVAFLRARGDRAGADGALDRAEEVAARGGEAVLRARVGIRHAGRYYRDGDFGRAHRTLKEIEGALFPGGPPDERAYWLLTMGNALWAIGSPEETASCWERAVALLHAEGDLHEEAKVRSNLLFLAPDLGWSRDERLAMARLLREVAMASGNVWAEGQAYRELAQLTAAPERLGHARRYVALARRSRHTVDLAEALRMLGLYLAGSDPVQAFRLHDEAMAISRGEGNPALDAWNWMFRSETRWRSGTRDLAVADSLSALDAIEAMRNLQPDGVVRARTFARWAAPYQRLVGHLLAGDLLPPGRRPGPGDVEAAFRASERRRARVLLDGLDAARATSGPAGPATARRAQVVAAIGDVQRRLLRPALSAGERRQLLAGLEGLEREEEDLRDAMARADPRFALPPPGRFPSLAEVRDALREDEALLSFQVAPRLSPWDGETFEGGSWVFVVTRGAARTLPLDDAALEAAPVFLGLFERRDGSEAAGAVRLYRGLVAPALAILPPAVTKLVIAPDGALHHLPIAALRARTDAEPLGARYEVTLAPSASVWLRLRRAAAPPAAAPALALADPELPESAPEAAAERAWALAVGARLGRLPHARRESQFAVRALGGESALRVGGEATERFLKQAGVGRYAVLHLAAHALVDDEKPERSAVLLSPGGPEEDGLLQIREVVGLDLASRVVVLSACRSAAGPVLSGEGVLGLAQAFFQAGARTVVGSLWPLRDDDAERIFRSFYRGLAQGETVAKAMSGAQRQAIAAGLPAAAWAGVVVLGDGDAVPLPGGRVRRRPPAWIAGLWAALAALGAALVVRATFGARRPAAPGR